MIGEVNEALVTGLNVRESPSLNDEPPTPKFLPSAAWSVT